MRRRISFSAIVLFFLFFSWSGMNILPGRAAALLVGQEAAPAAGPPAAYPRYDFSITLAYDLHTLDVDEKMTVANRTDKTWERLVFCATPAVHPGVFALGRFSLKLSNEDFVVTPVIRGSMLVADLPRAVRPGEDVTAELHFRLTLRRLDPHAIHPAGNLGYGDQVLQCGDCFPVLTPFDPERGFREWEYAPVGDPYIYPLADYDVRLRAEPGVVVAAAGLTERQGADWRFVLTNARSFAFTASKLYAEARRQAGDIPVSCFFVKGNERQAEVILNTAVECLDLFGRLYGPYPGRELVMAQNAYGSAMEYSSFITIANTYIKEYSAKTPQLLLYLTAHEISHQWWYNAVGNDQVMEPWLDDSLAKYSEYLYFRAYRPEFTDWWRNLTVVKRPPDRFVDDTVYEFTNAPRDYSRVIYGLAPAFISELHEKIGERAFFDFLRDYYNFGKGRFVTAADFFAVLGRHTKEDITPLLKKYFRNPPPLKIGDEKK
jgi:hypothetical protein